MMVALWTDIRKALKFFLIEDATALRTFTPKTFWNILLAFLPNDGKIFSNQLIVVGLD